MRSTLLLLLAACTIMPEGPATPGSPSATRAAAAQQIAAQAQKVQDLSHELEQQVDEGRRRMAAGESTAEQETERMRALMGQIEAEDATLQEQIAAWRKALPEDAGVHSEAAPAAPPPPAAAPPPPAASPRIELAPPAGQGR